MKKEDIEAYGLGAIGAAEGVIREVIAPEAKNRLERLSVPHNAVYGWVGLGLGVAAYDTLAIRDNRETLSHAFHRGMEHPTWKYMCIGLLGAVALHLTKTLPRKYDLFYGFKGESK